VSHDISEIIIFENFSCALVLNSIHLNTYFAKLYFILLLTDSFMFKVLNIDK